MNRSGFTLVEILVVIGIAAVLMSFVIVAVNPTRQFAQTRNSTRQSHLVALASAVMQNTVDNRGAFTCSGGPIPGTNAGALSTENLVGHWNFDEGSGSAAADISGLGNNGTLVNTPLWVAGKVEGALDFDGSDQEVQILNPTNTAFGAGSNFTFTAWVKIRNCQSSGSKIVEKKHPLSESIRIQCSSSDNLPAFAVRDSEGAFSIVTGTTLINDDTWRHIAGVKSGNTLSIYVDGTLENSTAVTYGGNWNSGEIRIGGSIDQGQRYVDGVIDEVRIYHRALDNAEISTLGGSNSKEMTSSGGYDIASCLVPTYLPLVPYDPSAAGAYYTGTSSYNLKYTIGATGGAIVTIAAPHAELGEIIETSINLGP